MPVLEHDVVVVDVVMVQLCTRASCWWECAGNRVLDERCRCSRSICKQQPGGAGCGREDTGVSRRRCQAPSHLLDAEGFLK